MAIANFPKQWQNKPPVGTQVNWGYSVAQGIVGCWLFNEAGGWPYDIGPYNQLVATKVGSATWAVGQYGSAFDCGAGANYFTFTRYGSYLPNTQTPFTIAAVAMPTQNTSFSGICGLGQVTDNNWSFSIGIAGTGNLMWTNNTGPAQGADSGLSMPVNKWNFVGCSQSGASSRVFIVNGATANDSSTAVNGTSAGGGVIGGLGNNTSVVEPWQGKIALVVMWNRALSVSELQTLYANPYCFLTPQYRMSRFFGVAPAPAVVTGWFSQPSVPVFERDEVISY